MESNNMDYKEKYEAALERGKAQIIACGDNEGRKMMIRTIFPELSESEDERIRKALLYYHKNAPEQYTCGGLTNAEVVAWLEKQKEPEDKGEISDGYHTFNELYYYRMLYNAAFFNLLPKEWVHKSKRHHDGEECFGGGWFIVMANLLSGQVSNHYELKDWDLFQIPEKEIADEWDGHTPQEAAERIYKYLLEKQKEQKPGEQVDPFDASWDAYYQRGLNKGYELGLEAGRKEHQPAEWSGEDEKMLCSVSACIENQKEMLKRGIIICADESLIIKRYNELIAWLKSLRPHWKPSEAQMQALLTVESLLRSYRYKDHAKYIAEIYAQLKKL